MELYSSAFGNHPTPPKVSGLGVMVASGLQGAWGPGSQGLGPGRQGPGPFPHKTLPNYDFFANLLVGAWRRRGCRLKRVLRRWGPGGKRSRATPPPTPPTFWGCKGERKRVFTLSAFGNHPTRPPRSADMQEVKHFSVTTPKKTFQARTA